jgi:hypothetical protein
VLRFSNRKFKPNWNNINGYTNAQYTANGINKILDKSADVITLDGLYFMLSPNEENLTCNILESRTFQELQCNNRSNVSDESRQR